MDSLEDINNYRELLEAHRQTLRTYLYQRLMLGFMSPPGVRNGIASARAEIRKYKQLLRVAGVDAEDLPDDERGLFDLAWLYHLIPIVLLTLLGGGIAALIYYLVIEPRTAAMPDSGWNIAVAGIAVEQSPGVIERGADGDKVSDIVYGLLKPQANNIIGRDHWKVGTVLGDAKAREKAAATIAEQTHADIVVYGIVSLGEPGRPKFTPEFYINRNAASYAGETLGGEQFGKPVPMKVNSDTQDPEFNLRLDTLRQFFEAVQNHAEGDYTSARALYEQALARVDKQQDQQVAAVIELFLGALHMDMQEAANGQAFDEAERHYRAAWEFWPDYARPYLGRAAILYQQVLADKTHTREGTKSDLAQFANQDCFATPDSALTSNAARLGLALRCYEAARNAPGQTETMDIAAKTTFGIGAVQFLISERLIDDQWSNSAQSFEAFSQIYDAAGAPAQYRLRQLMGYGLVYRALAMICPPDCEKPAGISERGYAQAFSYYEQGITLLQTYEPGKTCRDAPGRCYASDRVWIARYCQALKIMARPLKRDTKSVCPAIWDTVLPSQS